MKYTLGIDLGIDLGRINSPVSFQHKDDMVIRLVNGDVIIGHAAERRLIIDSEHPVVYVKRFMGDRGKRFSIDGKEYTPVEICSFILKEIVASAGKEVEQGDEILTGADQDGENRREKCP